MADNAWSRPQGKALNHNVYDQEGPGKSRVMGERPMVVAIDPHSDSASAHAIVSSVFTDHPPGMHNVRVLGVGPMQVLDPAQITVYPSLDSPHTPGRREPVVLPVLRDQDEDPDMPELCEIDERH